MLYQRLLLYIRSQPRLFCDETPLPRLDPGRGRTKVCQLWSQAVDDRPWQGPGRPAVAYVFAEGRGTAEIADQLAGFKVKANDLDRLLPWAWKAERDAASAPEARAA